jgi:hypothetical protein
MPGRALRCGCVDVASHRRIEDTVSVRGLIVACAIIVACSSSCSTTPPGASTSAVGTMDRAATATAGKTAFPTTDVYSASRVISGPAPQATALAGNALLRQFVLDPDTDQMWTINGGAVTWLDDTTLLAPFNSRTADRGYRLLRLDGSVTFVDAPPPTPDARQQMSTTSADGEWRLTQDGNQSTLEELHGKRRIVVPKNETFAWSPRGHVLATGGGRCGNVPVAFVDPDSEPPTRTVDVGSRITRSYEWRPDGSGIALAVILNELQSQILFVFAADATVQLLVPVAPAHMRGEPILGPWSPSGTYLLFGFSAGRPCPY